MGPGRGYDPAVPPKGGMKRIPEWAARIRREEESEGRNSSHPIELLEDYLRKHGKHRTRIERILGAIAARKGNRSALAKMREIDALLDLGDLRIPLSEKELTSLATTSAGACKLHRIRSAGIARTYVACKFVCDRAGIGAPSRADYGIEPAINRMCCEHWWRRKLARSQARKYEAYLREIGVVHRKEDVYVSDYAWGKWAESKAAHARFFQDHDVVNEDGEVLPLEQVVGRSLSNPRVRRAEMMVRARGFEEIAANAGDLAVFLTVTAPSRFHRTLRDGRPNPRSDGSTPRDAQGFLCLCWQRARAALARKGVEIYGFRIAEPHHDGTPHWHLLLYVRPGDVEEFCAVIRAYWMAESPDEPGAQSHRVQIQRLDPRKGTATGYLAKYVSKNIDGYGLGTDSEGVGAREVSRRVIASCSVWGYRQFQQIGGPPVTIWRELRRLASLSMSAAIEAARVAADNADWAGFVNAMCGPKSRRRDLPIRLLSETSPTRYGDSGVSRIVGVVADGLVELTRVHRWELVRRAA